MSKLQQLGELHGTDKATWHKYCDFYESVLPKEINSLLEIGVKDGASLKMWRDYYHPYATVIGMDILPVKKIDGVITVKYDATKNGPLIKFYSLIKFDIIIDDGSHICSDQRKSFELLWPLVKPGGFYIIEDVHSSFLGDYADESPTTYEWAMKIPGAMEWWRDPSNKSDSGTIIIPKPNDTTH
jgi:hypothetical protein